MKILSPQDLLTPTERDAKDKKRRARNAELVAQFPALAEKYIADGVSPERIITAIARKNKLTITGVKFILRNAGVYTSNADLIKQYAK